MKRVAKVLLAIVIIFLITSYFIPMIRQNEMPVANTFENVFSSISQPKNWTKWDPSVRDAWQKDSSACQFLEDTAKHIATIGIPGKKITVTQVSHLNFVFEETKDHDTIDFVMSIAPDLLGNPKSPNHSQIIAYAGNSTLFYRIFPFLERHSFAEQTMAALSSHLNNPDEFYGFRIRIKSASDTFFVTLKKTVPKQELFKTLPMLFDSLDQYSRGNHLPSSNKNVAYTTLENDSVGILAGININKMIEGDYLYKFMQLPDGQILAIAYFEGPFRDRPKVYEALKKYLYDHALVTQGVCFEKYLSPLPVSDSSNIKIELSYPLRTTF